MRTALSWTGLESYGPKYGYPEYDDWPGICAGCIMPGLDDPRVCRPPDASTAGNPYATTGVNYDWAWRRQECTVGAYSRFIGSTQTETTTIDTMGYSNRRVTGSRNYGHCWGFEDGVYSADGAAGKGRPGLRRYAVNGNGDKIYDQTFGKWHWSKNEEADMTCVQDESDPLRHPDNRGQEEILKESRLWYHGEDNTAFPT